MKNKIRIIIADDHPIFRGGLKQIIEDENDIEIVGEAPNGRKALELIFEKKPDVAILDVDMPEKTGFEVLKELTKSDNSVKIIFLTMYKEENLFNEAMDNGIKGYVLKESAADDICECIRLVADGDYAISPLISKFLVKRMSLLDKLKKSKPSINDLTLTERKILKCISENKSSKEIADEFFISYKTVETHRSNISKKLELQGSLSLVRFALENKSAI
ncbi:MAG TPA: response regulator transcription factor [Ignavibacteria bacterium]|nr:response regulator transcription factor [Ignavibacteria bacterium]